MDFINAADLQSCKALRKENTVIVLQDGKLRKMPLSDVLDYLAGAQVTTDTTLLLPDIPADAKATGEAIRRAAPRNLLDNSDFLHPINQRALNTYSGAQYTIDRWRFWESTDKVDLTGNGISVAGHALHQYLEKTAVSSFKSYTIACQDSSGTIHVASGKLKDKIIGDVMSFALDGNDQPDVQLLPGRVYVWAAIYEGTYTQDTLPPYQAKGPSEELAACKRYAQRLSVYYLDRNVQTLYMCIMFDEMRVMPTLTFYNESQDNLVNGTGVWRVSTTGASGKFGDFVDTTAQAHWYGSIYLDANI